MGTNSRTQDWRKKERRNLGKWTLPDFSRKQQKHKSVRDSTNGNTLLLPVATAASHSQERLTHSCAVQTTGILRAWVTALPISAHIGNKSINIWQHSEGWSGKDESHRDLKHRRFLPQKLISYGYLDPKSSCYGERNLIILSAVIWRLKLLFPLLNVISKKEAGLRTLHGHSVCATPTLWGPPGCSHISARAGAAVHTLQVLRGLPTILPIFTHFFPFFPYTSELKVVFSATRIKDWIWRTSDVTDGAITPWDPDTATLAIAPQIQNGCSSAVRLWGEGSPLPVHVFRKPDAGHWCHQLL